MAVALKGRPPHVARRSYAPEQLSWEDTLKERIFVVDGFVNLGNYWHDEDAGVSLPHLHLQRQNDGTVLRVDSESRSTFRGIRDMMAGQAVMDQVHFYVLKNTLLGLKPSRALGATLGAKIVKLSSLANLYGLTPTTLKFPDLDQHFDDMLKVKEDRLEGLIDADQATEQVVKIKARMLAVVTDYMSMYLGIERTEAIGFAKETINLTMPEFNRLVAEGRLPWSSAFS